MNKGFVKLSRGFFNNPFWTEKRCYSKAEAWLDLIQMARFDKTKEVIKNNIVELEVGQLPVSRRFLEDRWSWGSTKVIGFLKSLEKLEMIVIDQTSKQTTLTLVKYGVYNGLQTKNKPVPNQQTNQKQTNDPTSKQTTSNSIQLKIVDDDQTTKQTSDQPKNKPVNEPKRNKERIIERNKEQRKDAREFFKIICDYFSQKSEPMQMKVSHFLNQLNQNKKLEEFEAQTFAYIEYKKKSGEQVHGWSGYQKAWDETDWIHKNKKLKEKNNSATKKERSSETLENFINHGTAS